MDPVTQRLAIVLASLFVAAGVFIFVAERATGRPAGKLWVSYWVQFGIVGYLLVPAWLGGGWYTAALAAMALVTTREMLATLRAKGLAPFAPLAYAGAATFLALGHLGDMRSLVAGLPLAGLILGLMALAVERRRDAAATLLALAFPGWALGFAVALGHMPAAFGLVVFLYAVVELNDAVALMAGKFFGKRLIWPRLSPSKTIVGSVAGLVAAMGAAAAFAFLVPGMTLPGALIAGAALGVGGQAADLAASAVKRWAGVKDYGDAVPTHGGVLDVYDSFILTAPAWLLAAPFLAA